MLTQSVPAAGPAAPKASASVGRRALRPLLGFAIAAVFLYLTLRKLEWAAIREAWRTIPPSAVLAGLVALAAGFVMRIVRWWWMLRVLDPAVRVGDCARPLMASIAVNNTVPLRAGDFVRVFGFRGALRVPAAEVLGTLVVERVLDMLVLLGIFFAGLLGVARGAVPPALVGAGTVAFVVLLVGILALVLAPRLVELAVARVLLGPLAGRAWAARVHAAAGQFFATFTRVLTPARALQLLLLSFAVWGCEGLMYVSVANGLRTGAAAAGPWFAFTTATLATLLPSSPGYVGTFDYFAILGLTAYGAARTTAAAFALLTHAMLWLLPTVVGALCFVSLRGRDGARAAGAAGGRGDPEPAAEAA